MVKRVPSLLGDTVQPKDVIRLSVVERGIGLSPVGAAVFLGAEHCHSNDEEHGQGKGLPVECCMFIRWISRHSLGPNTAG